MKVFTFTSEWDMPYKNEVFATREILLETVVDDFFEMETGYTYEQAVEHGLFVVHEKEVITG